MVSITIDGQKIEANPESTILDTAKSAGIWIPTLCHMEGLPPWGSCRLCLVEIEGDRRLNLACATPVRDGLVVRTSTDKVRSARKLAWSCCLQTTRWIARCASGRAGATSRTSRSDCGPHVRLAEASAAGRPEATSRHVQPFLVRNLKPLRALRKVRERVQEPRLQRREIDFVNRGFQREIGAFRDAPLQDSECVFCGQCVEVCARWAPCPPSGTGTIRGSGRRSRSARICPYCGVGCTLDLHVAKAVSTGVTSPREGPANRGTACGQGTLRARLRGAPRPSEEAADAQGRGNSAKRRGTRPWDSWRPAQVGQGLEAALNSIAFFLLGEVHERGELPAAEAREGRGRDQQCRPLREVVTRFNGRRFWRPPSARGAMDQLDRGARERRTWSS